LGHEVLLDEFRTWVGSNYTEELTLREWWRRLTEGGWAFPSWPMGLGGRDLPTSVARQIGAILIDADVPGPPDGIAVTMLAPTLLRHGNDDQKSRCLPAIARGELAACQLFSEPGAGSDLASLRTRAVCDGAVWTVNGQKVWSSSAREADVGMLLARTNPTVAKHQGISFFMLPMDQPGVDVRPLRQMNGLAEFNEVFFDDALASSNDLVGATGDGWTVAQATLAAERSATPRRGLFAPGGVRAGWLDRTAGELRSHAPVRAQTTMYPRSGRAAAALARRYGRNHDPLLRHKIAELHILSEINRWTARRAASGLVGGAQLVKLQASELARQARDLDLQILGASGMVRESSAPDKDAVQLMALSAHVVSIGGGTDEIQKNVLGERILGLPKEPSDDRSTPFDQHPVTGA
jgi:alkylation response protein AidB-like acyl-CoA dehydrogenase